MRISDWSSDVCSADLIAGLVRGASKGEGLGNQFLANIREVDAVIHVLRCFEGDVTHVEGSVDPVRDAETVDTELMLADLDGVEKRIVALEKRARGNDKEAKELLPLAVRVAELLRDGKPARALLPSLDADERRQLRLLQLLTSKPVLYVCNVEEENAATGNALSAKVAALAAAGGSEAVVGTSRPAKRVVDGGKVEEESAAPGDALSAEGGAVAAAGGSEAVVISAAIEEELAQLADPADKAEFLETLGLEEPGLAKLIRAGYKLLDLLTFFTSGPKEARAWTVRRGAKAPEAAGDRKSTRLNSSH